MKFSFLFFCFLPVLHVLQISPSENLSLKDDDWIKCGFNDNHKMYVEKSNQIVRNLVKINRCVLDNLAGAFPISINVGQWIVLNKCLEADTEKISKDQLFAGIYAADKLNLLDPKGSEDTFIADILFSKAKNILDINDFKNIDEEKINQIQELKNLRDYILYPYQLIHKMSCEKTIFKLPVDYSYYGKGIISSMHIRSLKDVIESIVDPIFALFGYIFCPQRMYKWKNTSKIKKYFAIESVLCGIFCLLTYAQPGYLSSLSLAFVHAYIFHKNIQAYLELYEYQKNIKKDIFLKFHDEENPSFEENKKYNVNRVWDWREGYCLGKENIKICSIARNLAISSLDGHYLNFCKKGEDNCYSAYDVKNNSIVAVEEGYMIAAYLGHDIHILIKMKEPFQYQGIRDLSESVAWNILEIAVGKKVDNKIILIKSIEYYNKETSYVSLNLSKDKTKLFAIFNKNVQIFSLCEPNFLYCDEILENDCQSIKLINQMQSILQYIALLLLLYHSSYFNLRNKWIAEYNASIEREKWYEFVLSSMRLFKNNFFPHLKRFLRKEYIRIAKENKYSREWKELS